MIFYCKTLSYLSTFLIVIVDDNITIEDYEDNFLKTLSDDDYIEFVANFLRPTPIEFVFVGIFFCIMIVGVVGNFLVVYVVLRNKNMVSTFKFR